MEPYSEKGDLEEFYKNNNVVENYIKNRFESPLGKQMHNDQVSFVNTVIKKHKVKNILEIACGPARLTCEIKGFNQGYALDSGEGMLMIAKQRLKKQNWKILHGDAFHIKLKTQSIDLIYSFRFIRHFKINQRKELYKEIRNILKKNGLFILDAVNVNKELKIRKRVGFHKYLVYDELFKKKVLIRELEENGFSVLCLKPIMNHLYIITFISKLSVFLKVKKLGEKIIGLIEKKKSSNPQEWVVLCRKK